MAKDYAGVPAVRGIDLDVEGGTFFSLLGPSGCGKTTTLRMVGGFEQPSAGRILLDGADLVAVPPHRRPVNTVFQSYALFPFLDVWHNVAFGLRYRRATKAETARRVGEALERVRMDGFASRRPAQLSGGQQQRVALARALVLDPSVLLLDEPLGALDAQLRKHLQLELKELQRSVGVTFLYVTHDQEEALTMSDQLAVMDDGRVEQVGAPQEVYSRPRTAFVARFLGSANVLGVELLGPDGDDVACRLGGAVLRAVPPPGEDAVAGPGTGTVVVRPERVLLAPADAAPVPSGASTLTGLVDHLVYLGPTTHVVLRLPDGQTLLAAVPNVDGGHPRWCADGAPVRVELGPGAVLLLASAPDAIAATPAEGELAALDPTGLRESAAARPR